MKYKVGDKVLIVKSRYYGVKKGTIDTITEIIPPVSIFLKSDFYARDVSYGDFSILVELAIPNNPLSRAVYSNYIESDCGEFLIPEKYNE